MFKPEDIVSAYTTDQALADGVLVDARQGEYADVTAQHFASAPRARVVLTSALHDLIARAVASPRWCNDTAGVWHDVLFMGKPATVGAIKDHMRDGSEAPRSFQVIITGVGRKRTHTICVACSGDTITYGLPGDF